VQTVIFTLQRDIITCLFICSSLTTHNQKHPLLLTLSHILQFIPDLSGVNIFHCLLSLDFLRFITQPWSNPQILHKFPRLQKQVPLPILAPFTCFAPNLSDIKHSSYKAPQESSIHCTPTQRFMFTSVLFIFSILTVFALITAALCESLYLTSSSTYK